MNLSVEVLKELLAGVVHRLRNLGIHFSAQAVELAFDFIGGAAVLIDGDDSLLELDP